jgi:hypothetical protein
MAGAATRDENRVCPAKLGSRCGRARCYTGDFRFRMRPLVQVQPGPLRRFDLGKRSSLPLRSWLLPCVAFAQRSENTSLHSSTGAKGLPRLTSGTSLALREHGYLVASLAGLACGRLEAEVDAPAEGPSGNCSHSWIGYSTERFGRRSRFIGPKASPGRNRRPRHPGRPSPS